MGLHGSKASRVLAGKVHTNDSGGGLQHHLDHGAGSQRAVQVVQLLAAGGRHGYGYTQVLVASAGAQLNFAGVKERIVLLRNGCYGVHKALLVEAHHLNGKVGGVFNQRIFAWIDARIVALGWGSWCGHFAIKTEALKMHPASGKAMVERRNC